MTSTATRPGTRPPLRRRRPARRASAGSVAELDRRFAERAIDYARLVKELGRLPSAKSADRDEASAAKWMCMTRGLATSPHVATFTLDRRRILDEVIPGWDRGLAWSSPTRAKHYPDAAFSRRAEALGRFIVESGRHPRETSPDAQESSLASFLRRARKQVLGGHGLSSTRRVLLDCLAKGWDAGLVWDSPDVARPAPSTQWESMVRAHSDFVAAQGRRPSKSGDADEARLWKFISNVRQQALGRSKGANAFTSERRALLDRHVPGWDVGLTWVRPDLAAREPAPSPTITSEA